jgi:phosphohistidine phosphatase
MSAPRTEGRQLLLLRHGKAYRTQTHEDYHRPLKDKGKRGAQRMGVWLLRNGLVPDCIITSPAERALTTAEKTCKVMALGAAGIVEEPRLYHADCSGILDILAGLPPQYQRAMLVGHNPSLTQILQHLVAPSDLPADVQMAPASLAQLQMPQDWSTLKPACASLVNLTHARELPRKFPYPAAHSPELRDRPAYYYTQSSVIPYRLSDGRLEILITGSSKMKHWVVPKGIKEPGLSPRSSAAKEAHEEAGVEGVVDPQAIGSYQYEKWGSVCTVDVFPMAVSRQIPEHEWRERHRRRQWVSPEQAAGQLRQPELAAMVAALAHKLAVPFKDDSA